jgi:4-hydroxysphinganine ceramide fatty acyl 2-hydroxylase
MNTHENPNYMFEDPKIDYFFIWRWWVAPAVFVPVSLTLIVIAKSVFGLSALSLIVNILAGIFLWTLAEYGLHRFIFHVFASKYGNKHIKYVIHGMHHVYPNDPYRVIFPPQGSLVIGALLLLLFLIILPKAWAFTITGGFALGYCWYEFMHYAIHQIKWPFHWYKGRKRHHLLHHHNENYKDVNYGVTTSLWDHVFKTYKQ